MLHHHALVPRTSAIVKPGPAEIIIKWSLVEEIMMLQASRTE
jgi:hypothetical protein